MIKKTIILLLISLFTQEVLANETSKCNGKFINPITDVCWSCIFPISIGSTKIKSGSSRADTKNPSSIICTCTTPVPRVGVSIGFWEPVRLVDVTRKAMCLVNMGGINLGYMRSQGEFKKEYDGDEHRQHSFYHTHLYIYPLLYWLKLITEFGCLTKGDGYDIAYMSEFDPTYKNDANFLNPEVFLFANPIAQIVCTADCIAATAHLPLDPLFWCAGCWGSIYPFSGNVQAHVGGVQASSLISTRLLAKLHRVGLARKTATSSSKTNGELCKSSFGPVINKSQYRLQMTYPIAATKEKYTCNPLGMSDVLFNYGKEFPFKGEDYGYLVWRKTNCCLL